MSPSYPDTEIVLKPSNALTRPATRTLANRGLADLEATESADKWVEVATKHFSRDADSLSALLDSCKVDLRKKKGRRPLETWFESLEHRTNMKAYIDCLQSAVSAKPDYPKALMAIAQAYLNGWGVGKNRDEATRLLRAASVVASPDDLWEMSFIIEQEVAGGDQWPEGIKEAERMCRMAAEQGHAGGQHSLGKMYSTGEGYLPQDYELAKLWFSKAAENDEFPSAETELRHFWKKRRIKPK